VGEVVVVPFVTLNVAFADFVVSKCDEAVSVTVSVVALLGNWTATIHLNVPPAERAVVEVTLVVSVD
jgi:hypothetical protein